MISPNAYGRWLHSPLSMDASWAVWNEDDTVDFLLKPSEKTLDTLNPNVVMLSMNKSGKNREIDGVRPETDRCRNFHWLRASRYDHHLKQLVNEVPSLGGAYMTDVDKQSFESVSSNLEWGTRDKESFKEALLSELSAIGAVDPVIIAFGTRTQDFAKTYLNEFKVINLYHYSYNWHECAKDEGWLALAKEQLAKRHISKRWI